MIFPIFWTGIFWTGIFWTGIFWTATNEIGGLVVIQVIARQLPSVNPISNAREITMETEVKKPALLAVRTVFINHKLESIPI
jgi:hypothetical protein